MEIIVAIPGRLTRRDVVALAMSLPSAETVERKYLLDRVYELRAVFAKQCSTQLLARSQKMGTDLYLLLSEEDTVQTPMVQRITEWSARVCRACVDFAAIGESGADVLIGESLAEELVDEYLEMCDATDAEMIWEQEYAAQELHEWLCDMRYELKRLCGVIRSAHTVPDERTIATLRGVLADPMYAV